MAFDYWQSQPLQEHKYTLSSLGLKKEKTYHYTSRDKAEDKMYSLLNKMGARAVTVYEDSENKTYICSNGVRFFISKTF